MRPTATAPRLPATSTANVDTPASTTVLPTAGQRATESAANEPVSRAIYQHGGGGVAQALRRSLSDSMLSRHLDEQAALHEEIGNLTGERHVLVATAGRMEQEVVDLINKHDASNSALESLSVGVEALRINHGDEVKKLIEQKASLSAERDQAKQQVGTMERENRKLSEEVEQTKGTAAELESVKTRLHHAERELTAQNTRAEQAEGVANSLKGKIGDLEKQLKTSRTRNGELESELKPYRATQQQASKTEAKQEKAEIKQKNKMIQDLKADKKNLEDALKRSEAATRKLAEQSSGASSKKTKEEGAVKQMEQELNALKRQFKIVNDRNIVSTALNLEMVNVLTEFQDDVAQPVPEGQDQDAELGGMAMRAMTKLMLQYSQLSQDEKLALIAR